MPNSKKKGSKNEREVAKLFHKWTGYEFARTPQSGGLHWKKQNTVGDIVCIDDRHGRKFPFSIECKFHQNIEFSHLIDGTIGKNINKIIPFWEQCLGDAIKVNKTPILFMRKNGMKAGMHFVVMPSALFILWLQQVDNDPYSGNFGYMHYISDKYQLTIMNSEDFFDIKYKVIYRIAKKLNKYDKEKK